MPTPTALSEIPILLNDPSIISYWPLDGNANDAVGSNNGTVTNGTFSASHGVFGQGLYLPGTGGSQVSFGSSASLAMAGDMTISMWLYIYSDTTNYSRIMNRISSTQFDIWTDDSAPNYNRFRTYGAGAGGYIDTGWNAYNHNEFFHFAYTGDVGGSGIYYINGVPIYTGTHPTFGSGAGTLYLGRSPDGVQRSKIKYDDIALFNRVLTPTEIDWIVNGYALPGGVSPMLFGGGLTLG